MGRAGLFFHFYLSWSGSISDGFRQLLHAFMGIHDPVGQAELGLQNTIKLVSC